MERKPLQVFEAQDRSDDFLTNRGVYVIPPTGEVDNVRAELENGDDRVGSEECKGKGGEVFGPIDIRDDGEISELPLSSRRGYESVPPPSGSTMPCYETAGSSAAESRRQGNIYASGIASPTLSARDTTQRTRQRPSVLDSDWLANGPSQPLPDADVDMLDIGPSFACGSMYGGVVPNPYLPTFLGIGRSRVGFRVEPPSREPTPPREELSVRPEESSAGTSRLPDGATPRLSLSIEETSVGGGEPSRTSGLGTPKTTGATTSEEPTFKKLPLKRDFATLNILSIPLPTAHLPPIIVAEMNRRRERNPPRPLPISDNREKGLRKFAVTEAGLKIAKTEERRRAQFALERHRSKRFVSQKFRLPGPDGKLHGLVFPTIRAMEVRLSMRGQKETSWTMPMGPAAAATKIRSEIKTLHGEKRLAVVEGLGEVDIARMARMREVWPSYVERVPVGEEGKVLLRRSRERRQVGKMQVMEKRKRDWSPPPDWKTPGTGRGGSSP